MTFKIGDLVFHKVNRKKGRVINVNTYWGWVLVRYSDGTQREYNCQSKQQSIALDEN